MVEVKAGAHTGEGFHHQIRDTVVRITDPVGGGAGYGNCQLISTGGDDALGLTKESTFM
ncbi:hypothetical protein AB0L82_06845 [Nocardia sp. NPDC052001]|uniref:hypothetical protein n=1 Tax=Nocardia sp. NPDC052001 TaxID=3154853 RepID=UPI00343EB9B8